MLTVVLLLKLDRWDVAVLFVESGVVEPVEVVQGRDLDLLRRLPRTVGIDQLGLVETDDGLGEGVVVGVADGADRRRDTNSCEAFGECDGGVWRWLGQQSRLSKRLGRLGVNGARSPTMRATRFALLGRYARCPRQMRMYLRPADVSRLDESARL